MNEKLPKLALIGYGTMGKEIEKAAKDNGFIISAKFDVDNPLSATDNYDFDVAIDFSIPSAVCSNVKILAEKKIDVVVGATGWYDDMPFVKKHVEENNTGLLWGANFSIGMNIFMKITQVASKLINLSPGFDVMINEIHHKRKKDSPSGSALILGNIILKEFQPKKELLCGSSEGVIPSDALQITSARFADVLGIHEVLIESPADSINLKHTAKSRAGFASGALLAAAWIHGKKGVFSFDDILDQIWFKEE